MVLAAAADVAIAAAGAALLLGAGAVAPVVPSAGIASDTIVTVRTADMSEPDPHRFESDFAAAMKPDNVCGLDLMRRYITPERERIEEVCKQEAIIVDCAGRTVAILSLHDKVVLRAPLDVRDDGSAAAIRADAEKSGMKAALVTERASHGVRTIDGVVTDEFSSVRIRASRSPEFSMATRDSWTYDFARTALPQLQCAGAAAQWISWYGQPNMYAPELQTFFENRGRQIAGSRDSITDSGPPLPDWRIPLFGVGVHIQHQSDGADFTRLFLMESGNVRSIRSDDPIFAVPPDYMPLALPEYGRTDTRAGSPP